MVDGNFFRCPAARPRWRGARWTFLGHVNRAGLVRDAVMPRAATEGPLLHEYTRREFTLAAWQVEGQMEVRRGGVVSVLHRASHALFLTTTKLCDIGANEGFHAWVVEGSAILFCSQHCWCNLSDGLLPGRGWTSHRSRLILFQRLPYIFPVLFVANEAGDEAE